jgi:hypothetical protein
VSEQTEQALSRLVLKLIDDNNRLRAELAVANAAREILQRAAAGGDVDAAEWSSVAHNVQPEPCRCCARVVDQGDAWANHDAPCPRCLHTYADHKATEPCPCCDRGLDQTDHEPCRCLGDGWGNHDVACPHYKAPEPCQCCDRGRPTYVPDMLAECPTCQHEWLAHVVNTPRTEGFGPTELCLCCESGTDHGRYPPPVTLMCKTCRHQVIAHNNTRTEGKA